jgi:hypothetical protein
MKRGSRASGRGAGIGSFPSEIPEGAQGITIDEKEKSHPIHHLQIYCRYRGKTMFFLRIKVQNKNEGREVGEEWTQRCKKPFGIKKLLQEFSSWRSWEILLPEMWAMEST